MIHVGQFLFTIKLKMYIIHTITQIDHLQHQLNVGIRSSIDILFLMPFCRECLPNYTQEDISLD